MKHAIIVWHYYEDGKLVDYSITEISTIGSMELDLVKFLKTDVSGERRNKGETKRKVILHQVIIL